MPDPKLPFAGEVQISPEAESNFRRVALVHILTPEFHKLDSTDFDDIPDEVVERASAHELQQSLFWQYVPKGKREDDEASAFSYRTADGDYISVALTPEEYDSSSESLEKLAQRLFAKVLTKRDARLKQETGDDTARARSDDDIRVAKRGAMRGVIKRQESMEELLKNRILPKIELIDRFVEMAQRKNSNLSRGTAESVSKRFEDLRTTIFDDMIDAIALERRWSEVMTNRAKRIIQKRLYISGSVSDRVYNFKEMITLAQNYYGHKRALMLTKIQQANTYIRKNPDVFTDIMTIDEERRREKEEKQLSEQST